MAVYFHIRVLARLDPSADGATWGFRVLVTPGLIALWPLMYAKSRELARGDNPHGSPDGPLPSREIRRLQSVLIKVLAVLLPVLFAFALYTRPAPPGHVELPATAIVDAEGS